MFSWCRCKLFIRCKRKAWTFVQLFLWSLYIVLGKGKINCLLGALLTKYSKRFSIYYYLFTIYFLTVLQPSAADGPGEMGKGVKIPADKQAESKEMFKINQFNLMASNMISLNRSLPDVRMDS